MKLTIFAVPKPFNGHIDLIQRNAIQSWITLKPRPDVILFGDEPGTKQVAAQYKVLHIPEINCNAFGTPLLDSIFAQGQQAAKTELVAYVNADIVLTRMFAEVLTEIPGKNFMMSGQRWNLDVDQALDFRSVDWETELLRQVKAHGVMEGPQGMDYFVFCPGLYRQVPPFAIGRTAWDNWLLYEAMRLGAAVIDATPSVVAIHQNHDYSHHVQGKYGVWTGPEAVSNLALLGGYEYGQFTLDCADFLLTDQGLMRPQRSPEQLNLYLKLSRKARPQGKAWMSFIKKALGFDILQLRMQARRSKQ